MPFYMRDMSILRFCIHRGSCGYSLVDLHGKVVEFWGSQKLYMDFQMCGESVPQLLQLFKSQLYSYYSVSSE